jgi:hypothetical protein
MADEDENVRMPVDDRNYVAEDSDEDDVDLGRDENEFMDDSGEEESDEEDDDDEDDVDESDNSESDDEFEGITDKFICTFNNGDYDTELDDTLRLSRSVVQPTALTTQASYNKPDNWIERNQIGLEKVKDQLQTCIDSVSHLSINMLHNHQWNQQLRDNEEPIVWHEPILDAYWNQLEAEIDRRKQLDNVTTDIEGIVIENIEMKKEHLALLVAVFCSGRATISSRDVKLINTNLCEEGIVWLSKLVDINLELRYLDLHHNWIDNMDSARCLSRSIKSHIQLNRLSLQHCELGGIRKYSRSYYSLTLDTST